MIGPVHPFRGGIAHYTSMLAHALAERETVRVVSFRWMYPAWLYPGGSALDPSGVRIHTEAEYLLDPVNPLRWWQTARRIQGWDPDIVVFQWWVTFWAPAFAGVAWLLKRAGIRILFLIHNVLPHEERRWDRQLARWALRIGDCFIVHTTQEKARLLSLIPEADVSIHPHPIYDMFSTNRASPATAKKELGLPLDRKTLLFFGFVRPYKGLKVGLEAVAILRDRGYPVHLLVAGEFWGDKAVYTRCIEQRQLSSLVSLDDRYIANEEVGRYFSAADALIAPYTGGTQSGSATIALSFGLPLIVTDRIAEGIPASENIVKVIPAGDPTALADAVEEVFESPGSSARPVDNADEGWRRLAGLISQSAEARPSDPQR